MSSGNILEQLGYLFYVVSPSKTSFKAVEEIPDYVVQVIPHFTILIVLERCLLLYKKQTLRINDAIGSLSQGLLYQLIKLIAFSTHSVAYTYVYNHWRLVNLPWDSLWTWWFCFLGADFAFYWFHRASHEINILWAAHQVHHSSEDFNLTSALRQSVIQHYSTWIFNLPMALAIPPSVFLVHVELNLLYQFWIHTEFISTLGPLEYILNTASHHRVHHGRNRYCIDKNYAGVLIIWDRMFGTFQAENEEVVYGLTQPINTFEIFHIQFFHYIHIWKTFWATKGFGNKLSVVFKGPGWSPGTPWRGYLEDVPDVKAPVEKFDPPTSPWLKLYALTHYGIALVIYVGLAMKKQSIPGPILWIMVIYEVFTISSIGMLLEGRFYAPWIELLRCCLYMAMDYFLLPYTKMYEFTDIYHTLPLFVLRATFMSSLFICLQYCLMSFRVTMYGSNMKKQV